jgi:hypothetical protein
VWFRHNTEDPIWLARVGEKKWVVLSADVNIGNNPLELDALLASQVKAFFLSHASNFNAREQVKLIVNAIPQILRMLEENRFPFIAKIHQDGSVALWRTDVEFPKGFRAKKHFRPLKGAKGA